MDGTYLAPLANQALIGIRTYGTHIALRGV
jgi:hypothetical protein